MNLKQLAGGGLITAATLMAGTACKPMTDIVTDRNNAGAAIKTGDDFKITQNPNPKKGYKLHVKIKDAPAGGFKNVRASVWFDIANIKDCGYFLGGSFQGTVPGVQRYIEYSLRPINDSEYEGTFYADWGQDGDFFGKGVCHWAMTSSSVSFSATGAEGETHFVTGFSPKELRENKPLVLFYLKNAYPTYSPLPNMSDRGFDAETAKQHDPQKIFNITLTAQEIK